MENFDARNQNRVREKSVYLLHLDTPRIIILSCVIIGVLIVAFLVGMNLNSSQGPSQNMIAQKDMLFNPPPADLAIPGQDETAAIPQPGDNDPSASQIPDTSPGAAQPAQESAVPGAAQTTQTAQNTGGSHNTSPAASGTGEPRDVLTRENIREIIPPSNTVKKKSTTRIAKRSSREHRVRTEKKTHRRRSQRTVEVSSATRETRGVRARDGFSIQVGSFDSRSKAQKAVDDLRTRRFDSFIERTTVDGRRYYRVKVGPLSSQERASRMLSDIQEMRQYQGSYIVRE